MADKLSGHLTPFRFDIDGSAGLDLSLIPPKPFMLWDKLQLCLFSPDYETILQVEYVEEFLHLIEQKKVIDYGGQSNPQGQSLEGSQELPAVGHG